MKAHSLSSRPLVLLTHRQNPLTVREAATFCAVSPQFIREVIKKGELASSWTSRGYEIAPRDLLRYLHQKSDPRPSDVALEVS